MSKMKNQASGCTSLSVSQAEACKLPLLDGETTGSAEIIATEVGHASTGDFFDVCQRDRNLLYGIICTAWALVLRCYTGQDRVTFKYRTNDVNATAPLLRMVFDEDIPLSKYTEKAQDAITGIELERPAANQLSAATANSNTTSHHANTAVCICDSNMSTGLLAAKTIEKPMEVSDETCNSRLILTVGLMFQSGACHIASRSHQWFS